MVEKCWIALVLGFLACATPLYKFALRQRMRITEVRRPIGITRWILCAMCVVAFLSIVSYSSFLLSTSPFQIKIANYDVYRTETLKLKREELAGFVQIGIAVLGALWATMIVSKENRLKITDHPENVMFAMATFLLLSFLYFNSSYERLLAELYWDMGPILSVKNQFADILNSRYVQTYSDITQFCFYGGLGISAASVFSCCMLREDS
jgi:hypothetical protein